MPPRPDSPDDELRYRPPRWLLGGHTQTLYAAQCVRIALPAYRRESWTTPDGDSIVVDRVDGAYGRPTLVLFHGMEGDARSHYARAFATHCRQWGWSFCVPHFRGCGGVMNTLPRTYHAADGDEVAWIVERLAAETAAPLYAVGVSLGGNALLKYLSKVAHEQRGLGAAAAVSVPVDLTDATSKIRRSWFKLYEWHLLRSLKRKYLTKARAPSSLLDIGQVRRASLRVDVFDELVTAPLHGFKSARDYWQQASNLGDLRQIRIPTLLLNARNDPCLSSSCFPVDGDVSPSVTLEYPAQGGHVGFVSGSFPGRFDWLPQRVLRFLDFASEEAIAELPAHGQEPFQAFAAIE